MVAWCAAATGSFVVVERTVHAPFDPAPLARLPYPTRSGTAACSCWTRRPPASAPAAGTVVFLVGMAWWEGEPLRVVQLWLPDHPDEGAFLDALAGVHPGGRVAGHLQRAHLRLAAAHHPLPADAPARPPELAGHLDLLPISPRRSSSIGCRTRGWRRWNRAWQACVRTGTCRVH